MLRRVFALLVSGLLAFSGLTAAAAQEPAAAPSTRAAAPIGAGPLAPGGAAGIKQAQAQRSDLRNFIPFAVVGGLAILVVVSGDDDDDSTTTTTGTN
jgi:peptidoglycan/LPS O-acetylase OafA/YrhL